MAGASGTNEQGKGIRWSHWNAEAFNRAQQQDKPVLLSITAVWCYWCHVMEETTFDDAEVADFVNEHFVPVLIDNDHRPEVNARYNVGGWPTTAFLTPHGGYIAGATYLPPDQMLAMLMEVRRAYEEDKAGIYDQSAQLHRQRQDYVGQVAAGGEVGHRLVDIIARRMAGAYDPRHGGFGEEPKFPSAPILRLFLHLFRTTGEEFYGAILKKSLDSMVDGELYDQVDGGFFRFCVQGDWTEAQHEKMLEDNIQLAGVFLDAGVLLDDRRYIRVAASTLDFLLDTLLDREAGGFRGSQGAHSDYFGMPEEARKISLAPDPDRFVYTSWTCQAASLMLEASWKLPRPELSSVALELLDRTMPRAEAQRLAHALDGEGNPSSQLQPEKDLLCDWATWFNALMDAHNCAPEAPQYLASAIEAARLLDERFYDRAMGAYFDTQADPNAVGYLRLREKPLPENVQVAEALLKLHHATGEDSYRLRADNTLSAYAEANRDFGEHAAAYAVAVDHFLHTPVEITVEGPTGHPHSHSLALAASKVSHPHVIVKPVGTDGDEAVAHVCVETLCFPPVSKPEEIAESVEEALNGPQPTAASIFQNFVSF
ncbi:MAG: DUF255 domain-containing protein [Chloroflexota bacterium]|nr:DUF255 domain-containing protein [Chloroflexota bacterium]